MSNTALAWLAIFLFVIPFGLMVLAERVPDGPDWLDSEGFEMFMSLVAFVALMGMFPLVAANGHLVENGSIHLSGSVPVVIVSAVALVIAIGIGMGLIGAALCYVVLLVVFVPYELVFKRLRRAWRVTKQVGRDFDSDGYRIVRPPDYGIPHYVAVTGKPAYLVHDGWFRKVCVVVDDDNVTYYNRAGDRIQPPLLWGYSHRRFYGQTSSGGLPYTHLLTQFLPRRLDMRPPEAVNAIKNPPGC